MWQSVIKVDCELSFQLSVLGSQLLVGCAHNYGIGYLQLVVRGR
jgi:hypothetical protein